MANIAKYFGDSERRVSEVDALGMGLGVTLGLLLRTVTMSLPGGIVLTLGSAAGPLVVSMVLGAEHRTGPLNWGIPLSPTSPSASSACCCSWPRWGWRPARRSRPRP